MARSDEDILSEARERFRTISTAESEFRAAGLEDMRFAYNIEEGQWEASVRADRLRDKRPCLTSNKLRKFISLVANRERENRIAVKVRPVDDQADRALARTLEDIIRRIEYDSQADQIYAAAGENACSAGFGYWRILTDYESDSFDQGISIQWVENPFSVYFDPRGQYCFIRDALTKDEFERTYPDAQPSDFDLATVGEEFALWYERDKVFVAEYFTKEPVDKTIAQVRDPAMGDVMVVELRDGVTPESLAADGLEVLQTRTAKSHKVMWYKMTGREVLDKGEWAGSEIPVVEVCGDEVNVAGKTYKRSLVRDAKDPQRIYNYALTTMAEKFMLAPKAPWKVTAQMIKGYEAMWEQVHERPLPYVIYNPEGNREPSREAPTPVEGGWMQLINLANLDIKDVLGMFESFTGEPSNERSGRAIFARTARSDLGTLLFPDNLRRAIVKTARLLIDLIPKVYDTERIIRIRGYEGEETFIEINKKVFDSKANREVIINDLSVGKYDVEADVRLYSTRRQETVELLISAMQYAPDVAPLLVDLVFKYMDAPGAEEIERRLAEALPALMQKKEGS